MSRTLVLPLDPASGYGFVPITFVSHGRRIVERFVLDTGAAQTTLDARFAYELGIDLGSLPRDRFLTAGGVAESWTWAPEAIELLEIRVRLPVVRFARSLPVRGLLGNDLLRAADLRAVIDVPRNRAVLATHDLR